MQPQQDPVTPAHPAAPPGTSRPRGRTTTAVVWLAAGLLIGAGAVGAAWASDDGGASSESGGGAAGDARAACRALDGFDEAKYTDKGPAGEIALNRYAAAGALSASAAAGDAHYKPLARAIRRSQDRHARTFRFDTTVQRDLDEARGICRNL